MAENEKTYTKNIKLVLIYALRSRELVKQLEKLTNNCALDVCHQIDGLYEIVSQQNEITNPKIQITWDQVHGVLTQQVANRDPEEDQDVIQVLDKIQSHPLKSETLSISFEAKTDKQDLKTTVIHKVTLSNAQDQKPPRYQITFRYTTYSQNLLPPETVLTGTHISPIEARKFHNSFNELGAIQKLLILSTFTEAARQALLNL